MNETDQLSNLPARIARWIKALDIEPETVPSYHSQTEFWLEIPEHGRLLVEIDPVGTLILYSTVVSLIGHPQADIFLKQKVASLMQGMQTHGLASDNCQAVIRDNVLYIAHVGSLDETQGAKTAVAELVSVTEIIKTRC